MKIQQVGPNQTAVITKDQTVFFSYNTPVAAMVNGNYYRTEKKWSTTTGRHINNWLNGQQAEIKSQAFFDGLSGK